MLPQAILKIVHPIFPILLGMAMCLRPYQYVLGKAGARSWAFQFRFSILSLKFRLLERLNAPSLPFLPRASNLKPALSGAVERSKNISLDTLISSNKHVQRSYCSRNGSKHITNTDSFNSQINLMEQVSLLAPFYRQENRGIENLSDALKVTEQVSAGARICTQRHRDARVPETDR